MREFKLSPNGKSADCRVTHSRDADQGGRRLCLVAPIRAVQSHSHGSDRRSNDKGHAGPSPKLRA
jgi:hypothetical protein